MDTNRIREALEGGIIEPGLRKVALAELDKAQHPGKMLTDEEIDHIADTTPPPSRAKSYAEYCAEEAGFVRGLRYARDNGYLAPAAGLTVFEITEVVREWVMERGEIAPEKFNVMEWLEEVEYLDARLTAALEAKTSTA